MFKSAVGLVRVHSRPLYQYRSVLGLPNTVISLYYNKMSKANVVLKTHNTGHSHIMKIKKIQPDFCNMNTLMFIVVHVH